MVERAVRRRRRRTRRLLLAAVLATVAATAAVRAARGDGGGDRDPARAASEPSTAVAAARVPTTTVPVPTTTTQPPFDGWVDPASVGAPYGNVVEGVLTFRGNPTRTYYGEGPVPSAPRVLWSFPATGGMCSPSTEKGETTTWCGTGWTGQPAVFERDGRTWVAFGAYDRAVHLLDGATGERILPDFPTGDIVKGSVTVDPDGYPLLYSGSRDGFFRVLALDRPAPVELWRLAATDVSPTRWNDDWDGSALVLGDHLVEGGENSRLHVVRLHRGYGPDGLVTVAPELVFHAPGWDDELLAAVGNEVSIEGSVSVLGDTAYFANSGGLVQGWDLRPLRTGEGEPARVFRFWTGDDTDATVVVDEEGMLYVASEWERHTPRATEVGQILKLDPSRPDPVVWSVPDQGSGRAGVWATPAIHRDLVIVPTDAGRVLGLDRATGAVRWEKHLPGPTWQSPVVVDDVWIQGDCGGVLHAYDVSDTTVDPPELWAVPIGGCIESTPVVWRGRVYVGTRAGRFHALGDG
ncbi:MAG: PQQ-binding-like beta-propeller repeat protein [Acidimicrobiia bacterium]|nr:PQQ-binding-like beta-propeller repeat protein [Acidimicrobiia bacterium]